MAESCDTTVTGLVIYAHSRPGVLAKVASAFHRRGLNIDTLTVDAIDQSEQARIVVRVAAPRHSVERVALAIDNLVDVLSVELV